jgi:4-amino-4-deoxy-L-arabinose transferase-like glycosyltransferase
MNNLLQNIIRGVEVGEARFLTRLLPLAVALLVIGASYNFVLYHGLDDSQSMDNAQLARQIAHGEGYTTRFLRPQAIVDLTNYAAKRSLLTGAPAELFPPDQFPAGAPRILPDTYNAPGYPYVLAAWFYLIRPHFEEVISPRLDGFINPSTNKVNAVYSGDRWIPALNLIFVILTGLLVYFLGRRLFDDRVAWLAVVMFFVTDLIWRYSVTGLSTSFLMFLVTAIIFCALEIFCVAEGCFESEDHSFGMAWFWGFLLSLFLAAACLTRFPLLVLLAPLLVLLLAMPKPSWLMFVMIVAVACGAVLPWFWHLYKVSGHPWGTNQTLLLLGTDGYKENEIFCSSTIPRYDSLFRNLSQKELTGFLWHIENGWRLLGSNPLILLFFVSLLHAYKRRRAQMFQWFLAGIALVIIGVNNAGAAEPEQLGPWNVLVLLFPSMIVIGSAFFFIQLDRLNLQVWLLNNIIVILLIAVAATPMGIRLTTTQQNALYAFPPYIPPLIKALSVYSHEDEWVTSDIPWATAWYGNRPSLWLPDSIADFTNLHDNVCPTGMMILTPQSWAQPSSTILSGEDKDWLPFIASAFIAPKAGGQASVSFPTEFPLTAHAMTQGGTDYAIWSDHPRWQSQ